MNCGEVEEKLFLAESGELESQDKARLEEHLSQCEGCREHAAQTRALLEAVGRAPEMPRAVHKRILETTRAQARAKRKLTMPARLVRDFGWAAAVSAAAIVLFFLVVPPARKPVPAPSPEGIARKIAPVKDEPADVISRSLRRAIRELDSTRSTALGGSFGTKLDKLKDGVEAARFMFTTAGRAGLERQIGTVKERIKTLKEEMIELALYTDKKQKRVILDNGR
jgi:hypothetical protein